MNPGYNIPQQPTPQSSFLSPGGQPMVPGQQPSYNQQPSYTQQQPSYTQQQPSYTQQQPVYPQQQPAYPQQAYGTPVVVQAQPMYAAPGQFVVQAAPLPVVTDTIKQWFEVLNGLKVLTIIQISMCVVSVYGILGCWLPILGLVYVFSFNSCLLSTYYVFSIIEIVFLGITIVAGAILVMVDYGITLVVSLITTAIYMMWFMNAIQAYKGMKLVANIPQNDVTRMFQTGNWACRIYNKELAMKLKEM